MDTWHEDQCTCLIISHIFLLRMRNGSDKSCRENQNMHLMFNNFFPENCSICEITWKSMVEAEGTDDNTIQPMPFACRITKAADRHSGCIILISFPLLQWLHKHASLLCNTCFTVLLIKCDTDHAPRWDGNLVIPGPILPKYHLFR